MILNFKYFERLANDERYVFDDRRIKQLIIVAQRTPSERKKNDALVELFKYMHRVVVKHVKNYYSLCKHYEDRGKFEEDELISEFFLVLERCTKKFDLFSESAFHWYFDKSLTWRSQRMIDRKVKPLANHNSITRHDDESDTTSDYDIPHNLNFDLSILEMDVMGFSCLQKEITLSRMLEERVQDFTQRNNISVNVYYRELEQIKKKFEHGRVKGIVHDEFVAEAHLSSVGID